MSKAVAVALVIAMSATLAACDGSSGARSPQHTATVPVEGDPPSAAVPVKYDLPSGQAREVIAAQQAALRTSNAAAFARTWAPGPRGGRQRGRAVAANLHALGVTAIQLRLVAASRTSTGPSRADSHVWERDVNVHWSLTPEVAARVTSRLRYTFVSKRSRLYVRAVTVPRGEPAPPWLADRLHVRRGSDVRVATATTPGDATRLHRLLKVANHDIAPLGLQHDSVVLAYLPATASQFGEALGAAPQEYDGMAAVTTTLAGSDRPRAPMAIIINPRVWPRLRPIGARVVVTHEAVHALTGPVTLDMPAWLVEGFADDVAIRAAGVPLAVATRQALGSVRRQGAPDRLPTERDFSGERSELERAYQLSRLAMCAIRNVHGQRGLVSFYRHVATGRGGVAAALHRELATSRDTLTRQWRSHLLRLASAG